MQATPPLCILQVKALGAARLMVVADNHVSEAGWCCALGDGQRWFNEERFPVDPWLDSLRCGMLSESQSCCTLSHLITPCQHGIIAWLNLEVKAQRIPGVFEITVL